MPWLSSVCVLLYAALAVLGGIVVKESTAAAEARLRIWEAYSMHEQKSHAKDRVLESLSFGWFGKASERKAALGELKRESERAHQNALNASYGMILLILGSVLLGSLSFFARAGGRRHFAVHLLGLSLLLLVTGVLTPVLYLVAKTEVFWLGEVVARSEAKSVVGVIGALLQDENIFLAFLVGFFSMVVPVIKLTLSYVIVLRRHRLEGRRVLQGLVKHIGKWSMADVFVVAILIAMLAFKSADVNTDVFAGLGLYFFSAYCLLSIAAGQVIEHLEASRSDEVAPARDLDATMTL